MIILVCGGRDYQDRERVFRELNCINAERGPVIGLIHGAARGADTLAAEWQDLRIRADYKLCAENRKRDPYRKLGLRRNSNLWSAGYPAQWTLYGKAAGPIRNQYMLKCWMPDLVVSFPGGNGTADMVERAAEASKNGVKVISIT